jgi:acetoin utilization deacetylase AcuC-like enzyme|tara:strand:- start:4057 stop:4974 length:918 start_codon:yes stop_codon:yes gene_type:complete
MTTALITHPACLDHQLPRHPERPERLQAILEDVDKTGLIRELNQVTAREASNQLLARTHPREFIEFIQGLSPSSGTASVDPDTYMSPGSLRAARLAAGACIQATEMVLAKEVDNAFCAVRPPGHHTELSEAMGFCLFNNIAVAVQTALQDKRINRVAIVDFDVHHCNGTVDIFKQREEVLVCSSFQYPFYPNRYLDYRNAHIITSPLRAGSGTDEFRMAVEKGWLPAIEAHKPDMIFISAGFDAHTDDLMGELNLTEEDYLWVTRLIKKLANSHSEGRIVSSLEGGYDLQALAASTHVHLEGLME